LLESTSILRLSISITQDQFEKKYKSFGNFFILGSNKYFYDSSELKISVNDNDIVTKNYLSRQIIYNDLDKGQLNLFDILSGNKNHIEFMDYEDDGNRYNFHISSIGYRGYFLFEPTSGDLKLISFDNDLKHSVLININEIELLDIYDPKIEKEDFEVIDLRG
tara:strand:- start:31 stop:519 length:489 start_codon:yes stop_codon:yes gene_type:complete